MSQADARYAPDGYQYGVRFADGSVAAYWNGRTQHQRAQEYLERVLADQRAWIAKWGSRREPDRLTLVRRRPGGPWEPVDPPVYDGSSATVHHPPH